MKIFCDKKPECPEKCLFSFANPFDSDRRYICKLRDTDNAVHVCDLERGRECRVLEVMEAKTEVHLNQVDIYNAVNSELMSRLSRE